jgi:hypothetical protein
MSDDLVKDLRNSGWYFGKPAADRIEKDAAHIEEMYGLVAAMNADHTASKTRIEKLEAALRSIAANACCDSCREAALVARKALEGTPEKSVYKEGYRAVEEAMGHPSPEFWVERK